MEEKDNTANDKSLEKKLAKAKSDYIGFWQDVASVTGDTEDMRLLIELAEKYYALLGECNKQNQADSQDKELSQVLPQTLESEYEGINLE